MPTSRLSLPNTFAPPALNNTPQNASCDYVQCTGEERDVSRLCERALYWGTTSPAAEKTVWKQTRFKYRLSDVSDTTGP